MTVSFVVIHGAGMTGMHGIGVRVNTPRAAAVAAAVADATVGFVTVVHIPNGIMLSIGTISTMVPTGIPAIMTIGGFGIITRDDGAVPKLHWHIAPQTAIGIETGTNLYHFA
jgi:hypothetical protein